MTKRTTTFTLDSELMEKFQNQVQHGKRSETINQLIKKYVETENINSKTGVEKQIQHKKQEIEKIETKITELKSKKSNLENDIDLLNKRKNELDSLETRKQVIESFFEDQKEKMKRNNLQFDEFREEFESGVFDLFDKKYDFDLGKTEFWKMFEKYIDEGNIKIPR